MIKNFFRRFYLVLICVILYAPIITLMVLSFNSSKSRSKWGGFTTKWYVELFKNNSIMNALYTTLIIALLSALIATILGTAGRYRYSGNAKENAYCRDWCNQYPYVKCRYCDRNLSYAVIHRM